VFFLCYRFFFSVDKCGSFRALDSSDSRAQNAPRFVALSLLSSLFFLCYFSALSLVSFSLSALKS
jgi:hypothetical protein